MLAIVFRRTGVMFCFAGRTYGLLSDGSVRRSKLHWLLLLRGRLCGRHDDCGGLSSDNCC